MARVHDHQELHALQVQQLQSADPRSVAGAGGDAAGPATPSRGSPTPAASSAGGADAAPSSPSDQRDLTSDLAPLVKATVSRWTEFKVFILSTHTLDTGVGVIIGRALQDLLRSFVNDVLIPPLGLVVGDRIVNLFILLRRGRSGNIPRSPEAAQSDGAVTINYGKFVQQLLNFLTVGVSVFYFLRAMKAFFQWHIEMPRDKRNCPFCLSEIPAAASRCAFCTQAVTPTADAPGSGSPGTASAAAGQQPGPSASGAGQLSTIPASGRAPFASTGSPKPHPGALAPSAFISRMALIAGQ
ncbi:hypothetical protein HK105_201987 [Polyrhizophydium stewartii]|uniref:Large conductance mechanosensitive channel n=1 Tax=Polyrhizophydium stewartii TaxID=2732419 RepID=A0ABR4NGK2_9FUNG